MMFSFVDYLSSSWHIVKSVFSAVKTCFVRSNGNEKLPLFNKILQNMLVKKLVVLIFAKTSGCVNFWDDSLPNLTHNISKIILHAVSAKNQKS